MGDSLRIIQPLQENLLLVINLVHDNVVAGHIHQYTVLFH